MSGPAQTEKVDGGCFSALFSRLKIKGKRHTPVPEGAVKQPDRTQKFKTETTNYSNESDAPESPVVNDEIGGLPQDTACLELTSHTDLWQEAFKNLDAKDKSILGKGLAQSGGAITLIDTVRTRENEFKNESARLRIGDDEILWRDCAARVVGWLTCFGNIAITFAPNPASVIWSGLKVLLQAEVDRCEYLVAILKCAETVLPLVRRGAIYEKVYLEDAPEQVSESTRLLREAICNAYIEALKLMARVKSDLNKNAGQQFLDAILHPGQDAVLVHGLTEAEARIGRDVQACEAEQRKMENKLSGELLRSLEAPLRYTQVSLDAILDTLSKNERSRMLEMFSHVQVGDQHHRRTKMRIEGSGEWLPKHSKFKTWENSNSSSILWLTGQVGAGKTILASTVIDRYWIKDASDIPAAKEGFAYFYYSKNDPGLSNGDPTAQILGSFLRQLAMVPGYPEKTFKTLLKLRDDMANKMMTSDVQSFENALLELANLLPRTVIILDGLDEIERRADAEHIIKVFVELAQKSERPIKIFISSRDELHLRRSFEHADRIYERISVVDENHPDINEYIRIRVQEIGHDWPDEIKKKVESTLCDQARGMFRWAYLHTEQLATINSPKEILARLDNLPQGLDATYDELYEENKGYDKICLQRAVKWVMYTREVLHTQELLSAVQLGMNDDRSRLEIDIRLSESLLERVCRHLIVKDRGYWRFPHASVKEYFRERHHVWSLEEAQVELAEISLLLLIEGLQGCQPPRTSTDAFHVLNPIPSMGMTPDPMMILRNYVSTFWLDHFESIQHENIERKSILELFRRFILAERDPSCSSLQYRIWARSIRILKGTGESAIRHSFYCTKLSRYAYDVSPIDGSAVNPAIGVVLFSPRNVAMKWAEECLKQNIDKTVLDYQNLLTLAARYGRDDMLEKLIGMGMDVNEVPRSGSTPGSSALVEAVQNKQTASAKLLLEHGADANARCWRGDGMIYIGIEGSDFETLNLLLKYGADVDAINPPGVLHGSALENAAACYHRLGCGAERCRWLLDAGATVSLQTQSHFGNPILAAATGGCPEVMEVLLRHSADVHMHAETGVYDGILGAAFCGYQPHVMVPYLIEEAKFEPELLLADLSTRKPYVSDNADKRAKAAKYLYLHNHVTIADLQEMAAQSEQGLFRRDFFFSSLDSECDAWT